MMFSLNHRTLVPGGLVLLGIAGLPAIADESVEVPPEVTVPFEACGTLHYGLDGYECWFFETHNGGVYTIEFVDGFGDGDTVCVSGDLATEMCVTTCGQVTGCIFNNTIAQGFVGCGQLEPGPQGCLYLGTDEGGFLLTGGFEGYNFLDLTLVSGIVHPDSEICWPVIGTALEVLSVEDCPAVAGDLDGDGHVGFADVLVVLSSWGPCAECAADMNQDGTVDFADLLYVLGHWG